MEYNLLIKQKKKKTNMSYARVLDRFLTKRLQTIINFLIAGLGTFSTYLGTQNDPPLITPYVICN